MNLSLCFLMWSWQFGPLITAMIIRTKVLYVEPFTELDDICTYNVAVCNSQSDQLTSLTPAGTVLSGWEGNRRSGIAAATLHRLCGVFIYGLSGRPMSHVQLCHGLRVARQSCTCDISLRERDEHPAYTLYSCLFDTWPSI